MLQFVCSETVKFKLVKPVTSCTVILPPTVSGLCILDRQASLVYPSLISPLFFACRKSQYLRSRRLRSAHSTPSRRRSSWGLNDPGSVSMTSNRSRSVFLIRFSSKFRAALCAISKASKQCDQIGGNLKVLGDKFSYKSRPIIHCRFGLFWKTSHLVILGDSWVAK